MPTQIIILAQGVQSRLPDLDVPKQWLPLTACGGAPILQRTLMQAWTLLKCQVGDLPDITVVGWHALREQIRWGMGVKVSPDTWFTPHTYEMHEPGNSSLKGIHRALDQLRPQWGRTTEGVPDHTVVLLGDVVYSWRCLEALLDVKRATVAATSDLSPGGGELWGISWPKMWEPWVYGALVEALDKHPPFKDYQCGQLRRWYWEMRDLAREVGQEGATFVPIDDYTDDVDVPADVANLPATSIEAALDDATRGITWPL